jgi:formate/nitrite transporter
MQSPTQILETCIDKSKAKAELRLLSLTVLGFLAGAFIAFAAEGSNMAAFNLFLDADTYGLGKALAGSIFGTGLMLVIIAGGELFTGNTLMLTGLARRSIRLPAMLRNWLVVYVANFAGSLFIAAMMSESGLFNSGAMGLGVATLKIATYKVSLSFTQALVLGIMCNWLVCLAVWMSYATTSMTGKIFAIFFPIWLFITSGFEHSVANMYYVPAGIFIKGKPEIIAAAIGHGVSEKAIDALNWQSFLVGNLIPVTLGNIIGGGVLVGMAYFLAFYKRQK